MVSEGIKGFKQMHNGWKYTVTQNTDISKENLQKKK